MILMPILGALGAASVPLVQAVVSEDPPKLTRPCIELSSTYIDRLKSGPEMRELILPGNDGRSIVDFDPEAQLCGITREVLENSVAE